MKINGSEHNDLCIGIDLGTTNSVISQINIKANGDLVSKVIEIPRMDSSTSQTRKPTLPSCVYYQQDKNKIQVGDFAKKQHALRPAYVAKSIKSHMGEETAPQLAPDVIDVTPAEVSSRILNHLITQAGKALRSEINDAVITVPASFDPAMCRATLDAARLAGIRTENEDGSERPVLLYEPNAVIYDLINQIHNGEISGSVLDLETPKHVMVFDLGGGTLDVTLHNIKWRDENKNTVKIDEIAFNRYTLLGGDDFDAAIAEEMFKRYISKIEKQDRNLALKLKNNPSEIMPRLLAYAETLKIDVSNSQSGMDFGAWADDDIEDFPAGGSLGTGYDYEDSFSKTEVEQILRKFMGEGLSLEDYRRFESITDTRNIIYPILDVLKKAACKLGNDNVRIDEVILNGGMSKFYMVTDRLNKFFGFEPIVALDPDLSVSRGAAVYHYYLHQNENSLKDDMVLPSKTEAPKAVRRSNPAPLSIPAKPALAIEWGKTIINDTLFLGLAKGSRERIISAGDELPFSSEVMHGFRIEKGQDRICLPIQTEYIPGQYKTIERGEISLKKAYGADMYVSCSVNMSTSKILTIDTWVSDNPEGYNAFEGASVEIKIGEESKTKTKSKMAAPQGSILNAVNEISSLVQNCERAYNSKRKGSSIEKSRLCHFIKTAITDITSCGNKADFAPYIIRELKKNITYQTRERLFTLSRKLCECWSQSEKSEIASICMSELGSDIQGFGGSGPKISSNVQAIMLLGQCGTTEQIDKLVRITNTKYIQAIMYAFSISSTNTEWIYDKFRTDINNCRMRISNNLQFSAYALGKSLRTDSGRTPAFREKESAVLDICRAIRQNGSSAAFFAPCAIAIGWMCDQRLSGNSISPKTLREATATLEKFQDINPCQAALRMIKGIELTYEDTRYLLKLDEKFAGEGSDTSSES